MSTTSTKRGVLHLGEGATLVERPQGDDAATTRRDHGEVGPNKQVSVRLEEATRALDLGGRFVDEGEIGRGGMSAVHRVHERSLSRAVALKALPKEVSHDLAVRDRFLMEAQITGQLEHPNIVPVYELGSDDAGTFFFTMRLISGRSLGEFIEARAERHGQAWLDEPMEVFLRVCDALSFAHSRGVVHRDIKPSNIMVGEHGQVYLVDWGIAKVVGEDETPNSRATIERLRTTVQPEEEQGVVMGTFAYMSPEQAWGDVDSIDARTDVFGLGAVLYRILTGRPPYVAKRTSEMHRLARFARIPDPSDATRTPLSRALAEVAMKAMRLEREERHQSVAELRAEVQGIMRGRGRFESASFRAGTVILREGSPGDAAYIVKRGRCRVFRSSERGRSELFELGEGDVFGETAVFTGEPRNASVEALTEVELLVVPGATLAETLGLDTWTGAFVRALGERVTDGNRRIGELEATLGKRELALRAASLFARMGATRMALGELAATLGVDLERLAEAIEATAGMTLEAGSDETVVALVG